MNPKERSSYVTEIVISNSAEGIKHLLHNGNEFIITREHSNFTEIQSRKDKLERFFGNANPYVDVRAEFKPVCDFDEQESDVDIHEQRKTISDFTDTEQGFVE